MRANRIVASSAGSNISRKPRLPRVTLIGYGNWGQALASALQTAKVPLAEIIVKTAPKPRRKIHGAQQATLAQAKLNADIFWICTQDSAIALAGKDLAQTLRRTSRTKPPIVFHSSGALPSTVLAELQSSGAFVASVHPLMTFPRRQKNADAPMPLRGIPFAVEGDARACRAARQLVHAIGGIPFNLSAEQKSLYHLFGTFASPLLTTLLAAVEQIGLAAGFSPRQTRQRMRPIVERTVTNFFADGPAHVFSGPFARGDAATIQRHLQALRQHPELASLYRELGRFSLQSLPVKNRAALQRALNGNGRKNLQ